MDLRDKMYADPDQGDKMDENPDQHHFSAQHYGTLFLQSGIADAYFRRVTRHGVSYFKLLATSHESFFCPALFMLNN